MTHTVQQVWIQSVMWLWRCFLYHWTTNVEETHCSEQQSRNTVESETQRKDETEMSLHLLLNGVPVTAASTTELPIRHWAQLKKTMDPLFCSVCDGQTWNNTLMFLTEPQMSLNSMCPRLCYLTFDFTEFQDVQTFVSVSLQWWWVKKSLTVRIREKTWALKIFLIQKTYKWTRRNVTKYHSVNTNKLSGFCCFLRTKAQVSLALSCRVSGSLLTYFQQPDEPITTLYLIWGVFETKTVNRSAAEAFLKRWLQLMCHHHVSTEQTGRYIFTKRRKINSLKALFQLIFSHLLYVKSRPEVLL